MAFSQKQLQDRAFLLANSAGVEPHSSPVIDNGFTAELLFPHALRKAYEAGAGNQSEASSLKRTYSLNVVSGEVALPSTVLEECLDNSNVYVVGSESDLVSYEPRWLDFVRADTQYSQLAFYTLRGSTLCYRGAGEAFGSSTATINLVAIGLPDIPAALITAMTISNDTAERVIEILAKMLRDGNG